MEPPFYGEVISPRRQQEFIQQTLNKYQAEPPNEETKSKVYEELMMGKHHGKITIPFQVKLIKDPFKRYPDYIEVLLETKV